MTFNSAVGDYNYSMSNVSLARVTPTGRPRPSGRCCRGSGAANEWSLPRPRWLDRTAPAPEPELLW
jgi:hypothetical protein